MSHLTPSMKAADSRYPYTYACDFVRGFVTTHAEGIQGQVPEISRSQAARVMAAFEKLFGLSHEEMAKRLADAFLEGAQ
jgi:hypothetical protein